jgi:hypothetical protein
VLGDTHPRALRSRVKRLAGIAGWKNKKHDGGGALRGEVLPAAFAAGWRGGGQVPAQEYPSHPGSRCEKARPGRRVSGRGKNKRFFFQKEKREARGGRMTRALMASWFPHSHIATGGEVVGARWFFLCKRARPANAANDGNPGGVVKTRRAKTKTILDEEDTEVSPIYRSSGPCTSEKCRASCSNQQNDWRIAGVPTCRRSGEKTTRYLDSFLRLTYAK